MGAQKTRKMPDCMTKSCAGAQLPGNYFNISRAVEASETGEAQQPRPARFFALRLMCQSPKHERHGARITALLMSNDGASLALLGAIEDNVGRD